MFGVKNIFNMTCCNNIMLPLCRELNANCAKALLLYADDKMKVSKKKSNAKLRDTNIESCWNDITMRKRGKKSG